ncbi:YHS domain-containing (seleno)protein [Cyclobacterium qasimii]|uniref:YHS domain-containing protein n=2 Tax=Cyclobacterium qasimii TaxID=1350429 RepID=S7WWM2_9BACT|nr:YHS domain-containing (seleno)protein [Cyclobacterium qasimii]EPR68408.1 hypothetical protein ADICYQ_2503 [Cyclobacterium qasimii M12-11B]GEO23744.1 hypothetical protein CQA01_42780 [Cyclobacterium qasimii]
MNFAIKLSALLFISTISLFFQEADISKRLAHFNLDSKHLAIDGFDPVAYFTSGVATEGSKKYSLSYKGVTYYFSSSKNKSLFEGDPIKYEPQYGGWCAYAMGDNGEKVSINPKTFKIVEGKLYLFYNKLFTNTLIPWNEDEVNLKEKADLFWKDLIK